MNVHWTLAVKEARELIASAEKSGHEYVGVQRARAIVAVDEELMRNRKLIDRWKITEPAETDWEKLRNDIYNETP